MKRWIAVLGLAVLAACGGSSTSPSSNDISGTWTGAISSSVAGAGTVQATIAQSGRSLSGTWAAAFPNNANNNAGQLSGTRNGQNVSLTLNSSVPSGCPYTANLTLSGTTEMSGTYAAFNCTAALSGSVSLARQSTSLPPTTPQSPTAVIHVTTPDSKTPLAGVTTFTFDASGSTSPSGFIGIAQWDLGDGTVASGNPVTHQYAAAGDFVVRLTVTDLFGGTGSTTQTVIVKSMNGRWTNQTSGLRTIILTQTNTTLTGTYTSSLVNHGNTVFTVNGSVSNQRGISLTATAPGRTPFVLTGGVNSINSGVTAFSGLISGGSSVSGQTLTFTKQ